MMGNPKRIWAWYFMPSKRDDVIQGGWTDQPDRREIEYVRADIADDLLAALEMAKVWLDFDGRFDMQGINAAIAKARGQ